MINWLDGLILILLLRRYFYLILLNLLCATAVFLLLHRSLASAFVLPISVTGAVFVVGWFRLCSLCLLPAAGSAVR